MSKINQLIEKYKPLFFEIVRFGIVGAIAFLFDWGMLMLVLKFGFGGVQTTLSITLSTAAGFVIGVTINYILSVFFVFRAAKKGAGKDAKSAVIFLISAVVGLFITEVILNLGTVRMGYNETLVKIVATLVTMVWNYISRKVFIFR